MISRCDLEEVREEIQQDLLAKLPPLPEKTLVNICQIVVDRFEPLLEEMPEED